MNAIGKVIALAALPVTMLAGPAPAAPVAAVFGAEQILSLGPVLRSRVPDDLAPSAPGPTDPNAPSG
jgi:hypothetical protein